jgi:HPt (histidine-containing phosphotransfer) domain-containing protein
MDCQMPELDGFEATRIIRQMEQARNGKHITIIAMTANAMQGDREACLSAGMDDYISKPVTLSSLQQVMDQWVKNLPAAKDRGSTPPPPASHQSVDLSYLASIRNLQDPNEPDFLSELIGIYIGEAEKLLVRLKDAIAANDHRSAQRLAHTLKGSSGNLGARVMMKCCLEFEELANQEEGNEGMMQSYAKIEEEYKLVKNELLLQRQSEK